MLAGVVMLARVVVLAGALKQELLSLIALPAGAAANVLLVGSLVLMASSSGTSKREHPHLKLRNPFELGTVLKLAGLIAVILLLTKLLAGQAGNAGVYLLAAFSGIADVDALTLSMARVGDGQVSTGEAANAILIVTSVNTVAKAVMAASIGGRHLGTLVGVVSAVAIAAMGVVILALR